MSSSNRQSRRLSARLQEKEDGNLPVTNAYHHGLQHGRQNGTSNARTGGGKKGSEDAAIAKKRKIDYDEEIEGFAFTRAKTRRGRSANVQPPPIPEVAEESQSNGASKAESRKADVQENGQQATAKKSLRKKMVFSTPNAQEGKSVRRSRRISGEDAQQDESPKRRKRKDEGTELNATGSTAPESTVNHQKQPQRSQETDNVETQQHSATKIALPFADTPVIRRNKEMRQGRGSKGERRSSLGMRGRRASSLIDSGTSNALPHNEVDVVEFYKHIESEGLSEPRRMRQLLTWCATRAMGDIPTGKEFEDQSARLAARVIQEELLKDLSDKSEMSDWFSREDVPAPTIPVVIKSNPKNVQNETKIRELEEQIKKLKAEKHSLESLLSPPDLKPIQANPESLEVNSIDASLLSPSDLALQQALSSTPSSAETVSARLNRIIASLGPTVDAFTDGVHRIGQYRDAAGRVANRALSTCADRLEERDLDAQRKATGEERQAPKGTRESLGGVLRGLSRLES